MLEGAGRRRLAAQSLGLGALGFTSVYREGFETVLFLQALVLAAGVADGARRASRSASPATSRVGFAVFGLERKLPLQEDAHRRPAC